MSRDDRVLLYAVLAVLATLLTAAVLLGTNSSRRVSTVQVLAAMQARKSDLALYLYLIVDAESGQRGFLLTGNPHSLAPFERAERQAGQLLDRISADDVWDSPAALQAQAPEALRHLREQSAAKMAEMAATLDVNKRLGVDAAKAMVQADSEKRTMDAVRVAAARLDSILDQHITEKLASWQSDVQWSWPLLTVVTLINILVLFISAWLFARDRHRREAFALELKEHTDELETVVQRRTNDLTALSSHLQRVAEREKSAIARELHDELGGLMIAAKMDVSWLEKALEKKLEKHNQQSDQEIQLRFSRVHKVLDDGLSLKRRVVEALRPTLLDNLGLVPALKWVYQETCSRADMKCAERFPEHEVRLNDEAAIAVFRIVQESLINIVKHAKATEVELSVNMDHSHLNIEVRDNGIGMTNQAASRMTQGLASMKHRVISFGGQWNITTPPGGGTSVQIALPLSRVLAAESATA